MAFGPSNAYYQSPEWRRLRESALEEADRKCQACGRRQDKGQHVHHVYGLSHDPDGEHLAVLDRTCHDTVEVLARRKSRLTAEMARRLLELAYRKIAGPGAMVDVQVQVRINGKVL